MEKSKFDIVAHVRGVLGLAAGAIAGFYLFQWLAQQGFYALAIYGALMGLTCSFASRIYAPALAVICGVTAAGVLFVAEWKVLPFAADDSFAYFISHFHRKSIVQLAMFALGVVFAAWFGLGRAHPPNPSAPAQ